jgi:hypothetical protein
MKVSNDKSYKADTPLCDTCGLQFSSLVFDFRNSFVVGFHVPVYEFSSIYNYIVK